MGGLYRVSAVSEATQPDLAVVGGGVQPGGGPGGRAPGGGVPLGGGPQGP